MPKLFLLLVLALFAFAGSDAFSTPAGTHLKLSKSGLDQAVHANIGEKRMLRTSDGADAVDEERGMAELAAKLKTWVTNSKLVQMVTGKVQTLTQKRGVAKAEKLLKQKDVNINTLYENKVTPDELFLALKLDPKLKFIADSPAAWTNNPGLEKFFIYSVHYSNKLKDAAKSKLSSEQYCAVARTRYEHGSNGIVLSSTVLFSLVVDFLVPLDMVLYLNIGLK